MSEDESVLPCDTNPTQQPSPPPATPTPTSPLTPMLQQLPTVPPTVPCCDPFHLSTPQIRKRKSSWSTLVLPPEGAKQMKEALSQPGGSPTERRCYRRGARRPRSNLPQRRCCRFRWPERSEAAAHTTWPAPARRPKLRSLPMAPKVEGSPPTFGYKLMKS
jgi:hypothetical protein